MKRKSIAILLSIALAASITASCKLLRVSAAETSTSTVNIGENTEDENNTDGTYNYGDLTYKISNNSITITGCNEDAVDVVIPEEINGHKVVAIGDKAFRSHLKLNSVKIPNTVKTIGNNVFDYCLYLTTVNIPDSVTHLGEYAFNDCQRLSSVTLSNSLTELCDYTFNNCYKLSEITLPDSISKLGKHCFEFCKSLNEISLPDSINCISDDCFSSCRNLYNIKFPSQLEEIGEGAFFECPFWDLELPEGVKSIGSYAFSDCKVLEKIALPESLISIGDNAFQRCNYLSELNIPSNVEYLGNNILYASNKVKTLTVSELNPYYTDENNIIYSKDMSTLIYCDTDYSETTETLNIPSSVKVIKSFAFSDNTRYATINVPDSVETIEGSAFSDNYTIININLGKGVSKIGPDAFNDCAWSMVLTIDDNNPNLCSVDNVIYSKDMTKLVECLPTHYDGLDIPDSVVEICDNSINDCCISKIKLPSNLKIIGDHAFYDTHVFKELNLPSTVEEIGTGAFENCQDLQTINIPAGVTEIKDNLFKNTSIHEITIPSNVKKIDSNVFEYCYYYLTITILNKDVQLSDNILGKIPSVEHLKIMGHASSTAEEYAKKNNIDFEKLDSEKLKLSFNNLEPTPNAARTVGKNVKVIADATGDGPITYKFVVLKDNKAVYLRQYKEKNSILWTPDEAGDYVIKCSAKDAYGNIETKTIDYKVYNKIEINDFTTFKVSPQKVGAKIKLSTTASGEGTLRYKYTIYKDGKYVTTIGYRFKNSCLWQPEESGNYTIIAKVKDDTNREAAQSINYEIK